MLTEATESLRTFSKYTPVMPEIIAAEKRARSPRDGFIAGCFGKLSSGISNSSGRIKRTSSSGRVREAEFLRNGMGSLDFRYANSVEDSKNASGACTIPIPNVSNNNARHCLHEIRFPKRVILNNTVVRIFSWYVT